MFGAAPAAIRITVTPRPDHAKRVPHIRRATETRVVIDDRFQLQVSHPVSISGATIEAHVPRGEKSWAALSDAAAATVIVDESVLRQWLAATLDGWRRLAERCPYQGVYREQVHASLRALRLLVYQETGAIAAAATTSLPEVIGGKRNFDYRYSWLRDSGLAVRALSRFEPEGTEARRHLGFVAGLFDTGYRKPLDPVSTIGGERVPSQVGLRLAGYRGSRPVWAGNKSARQLQLGSLAAFLLAALEIYERFQPREHWQVVSEVANYLAANWRRRDHGIWEQKRSRSYTAGKVFAACALEGIARFAEEPTQAERYRAAARDIRGYVAQYCRTRAGGYAAIAGTEAVDISAALYPVFGYTAATDEIMAATIRGLEQKYSIGNELYHRHLDSSMARRREGAFLAGTFWIAHYWIARGDLDRGRRMIDAGLTHATDLGLFPEEIEARSGRMLGNLPVGLVHASFLAAAADYHEALSK